MRYTVVLVPDRRDGGFVAYVPSIPGCVTQGEFVEDALAMARDAATALAGEMVESGEEVPGEPERTIVASIDADVPSLAMVLA